MVDVSVVVEVEVVEEVDSVVLGSRVVAVCHDLCRKKYSSSILQSGYFGANVGGHVGQPTGCNKVCNW